MFPSLKAWAEYMILSRGCASFSVGLPQGENVFSLVYCILSKHAVPEVAISIQLESEDQSTQYPGIALLSLLDLVARET